MAFPTTQAQFTKQGMRPILGAGDSQSTTNYQFTKGGMQFVLDRVADVVPVPSSFVSMEFYGAMQIK